MIDALIWAVSFVLMCGFLGGGAVLSVRMVEQGKNMRQLESEKTQRQGMENAYMLEQAKLDARGLPAGTTHNDVRETFQLKDESWKSR